MIEKGFAKEEHVLPALAEEFGMDLVDLTTVKVDPELLKTYEKLGIPLHEREILAGVAVDAVFDSVSVATTFKEKLASMGIIFC